MNTPVEVLEQLSTATSTLWVKRDDLTHAVYGGSKARKLGPLLEDAKRCGATRVVTLGGVGSHHVLATGVFGKLAELPVEAVLLARPGSAHVLETLRATIAQGVTLVPAESYTKAARHLAAAASAGAYAIPAGGSNAMGTRGVLAAAAELAGQVSARMLPEPDVLVLPLGSGGTAAGLAAGLAHHGLRTRVLAVAIAEPVKLFARRARALAQELTLPALHADVSRRLQIDERYLGNGYGHATAAGEHATREASRAGLTLDATYTAKAFAAALALIALGRERQVLYWHTLSSAPLAPLLQGAPLEQDLPNELRRLAR